MQTGSERLLFEKNLQLPYENYIFVRQKYKTMNSKLTVRLDSNVIDRAKSYARNHKISVSRMIESYLDSVTQQKSMDIEITPLVSSLSGVVKLSADYDFKKDYGDYLSGKYK